MSGMTGPCRAPRPVVTMRGVGMAYRRHEVFRDVSVDLAAGRILGVLGPNGSGKTTLLRLMVGLIRARAGQVLVGDRAPTHGMAGAPVAYFGGEATLPGGALAGEWASLCGGERSPDRQRVQSLSRGARQQLGLRTVLSRSPIALIVLDEPWEGLDPDASRWLSRALIARRDEGAAVVLSSHRLHDLAGVCDEYLFLANGTATVVSASHINPGGPVTGEHLMVWFERTRGGAQWSDSWR